MLATYYHSTPIPLRAHKKSSGGCKACKARKVKCDEQKPVCGKCAIHFSNITQCDYEPTGRRVKKSVGPVLPKPQRGSTHSDAASVRSSGSRSSSKLGSSDSGYQSPITDPCSETGSHSTKATAPIVSIGQKRIVKASVSGCKCPCHVPEYSDMLGDALLGICRICGNLPMLSSSIDQCNPVVTSEALVNSSIDPFSILPTKSTQSVQSLIYHYVNTLALFPTKIHSQYCTNPTWLTAAISNPALFNVTLYVSSLHQAALKSVQETKESVYYKGQTVNCLNDCLKDNQKAVSDETIAAVMLLMFAVCIVGEKHEIEAHVKGLSQMIQMRGGIHSFAIDGVFLHMLCTTNHLTAVLDESPSLHPPVKGTSQLKLPGIRNAAFPTSQPLPSSNKSPRIAIHESPLWKPFALKIGFHETIVDVLHLMGYMYSVVDAFTLRLLPYFRDDFNEIVQKIIDDVE